MKIVVYYEHSMAEGFIESRKGLTVFDVSSENEIKEIFKKEYERGFVEADDYEICIEEDSENNLSENYYQCKLTFIDNDDKRPHHLCEVRYIAYVLNMK